MECICSFTWSMNTLWEHSVWGASRVNKTYLVTALWELPGCMLSHSVVSSSLRHCGRQLTKLSVHGILQARILEWVAMPSSRGSFWPRDRTRVSCVSCLASRFFTCWAIREAQGLPHWGSLQGSEEEISTVSVLDCLKSKSVSCSVRSDSLQPQGL